MITFHAPDLNAPRFRPKKCNLLNSAFCRRFRKKNPRHKNLTDADIKKIVTIFNGSIWNKIIDYRDGVELPEGLGYVFIGSCPRKVRDNPDFRKSIAYGYKVRNTNWESDQYVAKIFYTNYEDKYRFKFHQLWGFTGVRDFKRGVAHTYPSTWKKYVLVESNLKVSKLFRKSVLKDRVLKQQEKDLKVYDEFDLS